MWRHVDVDALWTLVLALLRPRSFLGWPGMMGMENGCFFVVLWQAWYWRVCTLSGPPSTQRPWQLMGDWDRPSSCVSLRTLLKEFPVLCARAVRTSNLVHYFRCPCIWQFLFWVSGCCIWYENWILRETTFFVGAMLGTTVDTCSVSVLWWLWKNLHIFYVVADSFPETLLLHSV